MPNKYMKKYILMLLMIVFTLPLIFAYTVFPRPTVGNTLYPNTYFIFNFTFVGTDGESLFSNQSNLSTDSSGVAFSLLDISSITEVPDRFLHYRNGVLIVNQSFNSEIFDRVWAKTIIANQINGSWNGSVNYYLKSEIDTINSTYNIQNLLNSTNVYSTYNASYVPYTGTINNVLLGDNNLTVNVVSSAVFNVTNKIDFQNGLLNITGGDNSTIFTGQSATVSGITYSNGIVFDYDETSLGTTIYGFNTRDANSRIFFGGAVLFTDNQAMWWGGSSDSNIMWDTSGNDYMTIRTKTGTSEGSGNFVFQGYPPTNVHPETYPIMDDPTFWINDNSTDFSHYLYLQHNSSNAFIQSGNGSLWINNSVDINGNVTADTFFGTWNNSIFYLTSTQLNTTYDYSFSTYNSTYEGCVNNATYISTYNNTYDGLINNGSYLSTYNSTYDTWKTNYTLFHNYVGNLSISKTGGGASPCLYTIQVKNYEGANVAGYYLLKIWDSTSAYGARDASSYGLTDGGNGFQIYSYYSYSYFDFMTNSNGNAQISYIFAGEITVYLHVEFDGKVYVGPSCYQSGIPP